MPEPWKQARVLGAYYSRLARALLGETACPVARTFRIAPGWLDDTKDPPQPVEPPFDASALPADPVFSGTVSGSASDKSALLTCVVPEGAVSAPTRVTAIGIYDQSDTLIAAASFLPEWITPDKEFENLIHVTFPEE